MKNIDGLKSVVEEILTPEELNSLFSSGKPLRHYIGFEISGKVHLGSGLATMLVIKELQKLGVKTTVFLADWHSFINQKLDGDPKIIKELALSYFKEAMIASALCVSADPSKIEFILGSDLYQGKADYWQLVLDVSSHVTISRSKRSTDIAGRQSGDEAPTSILFYPMMQIADIFYMNINIAHAGTDQRKAHVVARTVVDKLKTVKKTKPVAIHNHLLMGLGKPPIWPVPEDKKREMLTSLKMSKSIPDSAVFIHDDPDTIKNKITKAFCPPGETEYNPIVDWITNLIFPIENEFILERSEKFGGTKKYTNKNDFLTDYQNENIHPSDLKPSVIKYLIDILKPSYKYFEQKEQKKALQKLESIHITR